MTTIDNAIFRSWDDVGFDDFRSIALEACDPRTAAPLLAANTSAKRAYDHPGVRGGPRHTIDQADAKAATAQLRAFVGRRKAQLQNDLRSVDGRYLLGAVAALGAIPELYATERVALPGRYDRELEWLSGLQLAPEGSVPGWSDVLHALRIARSHLVADAFAPDLQKSVFARLRERSMMASDLGATYVPVSRDLSRRLVGSAMRSTALRENSDIANFVDDTEDLFDRHLENCLAVVGSIEPPLTPTPQHSDVLRAFMRTWTVDGVVQRLALPPALAQGYWARSLTSQLTTEFDVVDLRAKPLLEFDGSALLLLARRVACDRHEVFDIGVSRLLRDSAATPGTYPDLRAAMLDDLVRRVLERVLPGCRIVTGQVWSIDGKPFERDVVAFYEDVAICIETKAPQMIPSRRATYGDVADVLRRDVAHGVRQVTNIANALEAGTASYEGVPAPRVRRAYRLVASLNTWWGIDLAVNDLVEAGVLPETDSAMLTCAGSLVCYEKVFETPGDFIAYLDFRLSHQRRPWVVVPDETELIGEFFTNPSDEWAHRPPPDVRLLIRPAFQEQMNAAMRAAYFDTTPRRTLVARHQPFVMNNMERWRRENPSAWLQAYSALARTPRHAQREIEGLLQAHRRSGSPLIRKHALPGRAGHVIVIEDPSRVTCTQKERLIRNAPSQEPAMVIDGQTHRVLAIRGRDDRVFWVDSAWTVTDSAGQPPTRQPSRGQRQQPRRKHRKPR